MTETLAHRRFDCGQCGATLTWDPGVSALKCPYCGFVNQAAEAAAPDTVRELDFREGLALGAAEAPVETIQVVKCSSCAAEFTLQGEERSRPCPFCGAPVVVDAHPADRIRPGAVLPFKITAAEARERYRSWLGRLWFAPGGLKRQAATDRGLSGMYVPFWTYDCGTTSRYTGERGEDYFTTETYKTQENGKSVTRTRQVKKTRWWPASGTVSRHFDDVLVLASNSLPQRHAERLEPWDLGALAPYDAGYLSGFGSETYQIDIAGGFDIAKTKMEPEIRRDVAHDIGGDHQRIHSLTTQHSDVTYKHLLLPVWLATYRFGGKPYRFLVNARTGEVQGERPWSWLKIAGLIAVIIAIIAAIIIFWPGGSPTP